MRMAEEIVSINRSREHHAVAIVDRSTTRFDIHCNGALRIAGMLDGMRIDDLNPHQTSEHDDRDRENNHEQDAQTVRTRLERSRSMRGIRRRRRHLSLASHAR